MPERNQQADNVLNEHTYTLSVKIYPLHWLFLWSTYIDRCCVALFFTHHFFHTSQSPKIMTPPTGLPRGHGWTPTPCNNCPAYIIENSRCLSCFKISQAWRIAKMGCSLQWVNTFYNSPLSFKSFGFSFNFKLQLMFHPPIPRQSLFHLPVSPCLPFQFKWPDWRNFRSHWRLPLIYNPMWVGSFELQAPMFTSECSKVAYIIS